MLEGDIILINFMEPELIFADIFDLLHDCARNLKTTVIIVTHDPLLAQKADETLYLKAGSLSLEV